MDHVIHWLLQGEPWVVYHTRLKLLEQEPEYAEVFSARDAMLSHPQVKTLIGELQSWPGPVLKRHNDAKHLLHKLVFAADLGLTVSDEGVAEIVEKIMDLVSPDGLFQVTGNIHPRWGGSGEDEPLWMLCDSPSIIYALAKMGLKDNPDVQKAAKGIEEMVRENGWPCKVQASLGKFKGPGKAEDPCPYATLISLKALSEFEDYKDSQACKFGVETILDLWENSLEKRPFLFKMGNKFRKLKLPYIWYDILHVLEVLSRFSWAREKEALLQMRDIVISKVQEGDRYQPESIWMAWKGWEFGQKKEPSRWMTLQILDILKRWE